MSSKVSRGKTPPKPTEHEGKGQPPATWMQAKPQSANPLARIPVWALLLILVAIVLILLFAMRGCGLQITPTTTSALKATGTMPAVLEPVTLKTVGQGDAGYRQLSIRGLSYAQGRLALWGAVKMPAQRYADQEWQVTWVGDDVVGKLGLEVTDTRITWFPVTGEWRKQDEDGVLATWIPPDTTRCLMHIKLEGKAGHSSERIYAKFDIRGLRPGCIK